MLKSVRYKNLKALRDTELPLSPFTLVVGPNGSGKSTALRSLAWFGSGQANGTPSIRPSILSFGAGDPQQIPVEIALSWDVATGWDEAHLSFLPANPAREFWYGNSRGAALPNEMTSWLNAMRMYELEAKAICSPVELQANPELGVNGSGLAAVLGRMRDTHPEHFEKLSRELSEWLPEFDRILFEVPANGIYALSLRTKGGAKLAIEDLSNGSVVSLALLTLAYLPDPPSLVGLEEPDRGIHPRLLRHVKDSLYRLAFPRAFGEDRSPVQVIATTHSPTFLDQFVDHPEEVVIAHKEGLNVRFERLVDKPEIHDVLDGASLGDIWYSGILGGVPAAP